MKWDEMTAWERNMLVHTHVMGNPGGGIPEYTTDLRIAWLVLKKMLDMQTDRDHLGELTPQFEEFSDLLFDGWTSASTHGDIYPGYRIIEIAATWTPESICKTALKACKVDI